MDTFDLFVGYDIHVSPQELDAESNLEDADTDASLFGTREIC
ncbi:hypothetical protein [Streptomyces sp. NPDC085932]